MLEKISKAYVIIGEIIMALGVIILITFNTVFSIGTRGYDSDLICHECGEYYQTVTGYCERCGTKHSDDDFAILKAHCPSCGAKLNDASAIHCHLCGSEVEPETKIKIKDIKSGFVRWCVEYNGPLNLSQKIFGSIRKG